MTSVISWLEAVVGTIPLPLLEVWGRFSYIVGLVLAVCAFGGFTFRVGEQWGFGRERQTWDAKALLSMPLTFALVIASGYIGSFIVLVPGAQTFESLKDLVVLLCIVLLGYPALIAVPPAYMLSDLIEGVPPDFVLSWAEGYFFWTAFVWMAYQLIGRNPDFRRALTWRRYGVFVGLIMLLDPAMWGFICSGQFTSAISYRNISSALLFTLTMTWLLAPGGLSGRPAAGQTVRMVLGGNPRIRPRARARRAANGCGKPAAAARREARARCRRGSRSGSSSSCRSSRWCS